MLVSSYVSVDHLFSNGFRLDNIEQATHAISRFRERLGWLNIGLHARSMKPFSTGLVEGMRPSKAKIKGLVSS